MMINQNTNTMTNNTDLSHTALPFVPPEQQQHSSPFGGGGASRSNGGFSNGGFSFGGAGGGGGGGSGGGGASAPRSLPRSHAPSRAGGRTAAAKDCSVCRRTFKNRSELQAHLAFSGHRTVRRRYAFRFKAAAGGGFKGVRAVHGKGGGAYPVSACIPYTGDNLYRPVKTLPIFMQAGNAYSYHTMPMHHSTQTL